jgi:hypothetical protein
MEPDQPLPFVGEGFGEFVSVMGWASVEGQPTNAMPGCSAIGWQYCWEGFMWQYYSRAIEASKKKGVCLKEEFQFLFKWRQVAGNELSGGQ